LKRLFYLSLLALFLVVGGVYAANDTNLTGQLAVTNSFSLDLPFLLLVVLALSSFVALISKWPAMSLLTGAIGVIYALVLFPSSVVLGIILLGYGATFAVYGLFEMIG
jgi:hypothetical protein